MNEGKVEELRREIDRIDEQLISLLARRLELAGEIASIKREVGRDVRDALREREVIERARRVAKGLGIDADFAESVMGQVIAQSAKEELERVSGARMWSEIQRAFEGNPAQLSVARVLLKYGLRVREDGEIACGDIRVPAVQIAAEAGVDRRAVSAAVRTILRDEKLFGIFSNLMPSANLKGAARRLGLGVIEILAEDATKPGVIHEVTGAISKFGISVRQAIADDPYLTPTPRLTVITGEPLSGEVIEALRRLPSVQSVIVY